MEHEKSEESPLRSYLDEAIEAIRVSQENALSFGYGAAALTLADSNSAFRLASDLAACRVTDLTRTIDALANDWIKESAEAARRLTAAGGVGAALAKLDEINWGIVGSARYVDPFSEISAHFRTPEPLEFAPPKTLQSATVEDIDERVWREVHNWEASCSGGPGSCRRCRWSSSN